MAKLECGNCNSTDKWQIYCRDSDGTPVQFSCSCEDCTVKIYIPKGISIPLKKLH